MKTRVFCAILILVSVALYAQSDSQILKELQRRIGPVVTIAVDDGTVTLKGTTSGLAQKLSIINMARRTTGVSQVVDRITVVPAVKQTDDQIADAVRKSFSANLGKQERDAVNVQVRNGVVTLTGTLPSSYPKQIAAVLAANVPGVAEVSNQIAVKPPVQRTDDQIVADVTAKFAKNPIIPAKDIAITVNNGVVTLSGTVGTFVQADQSESVARFVPGVIDVRNLLFVKG